MIPALITAGAMLANAFVSKGENDRNRRFNSLEAQKGRDYTSYLLKNESKMKVADARQAGLNPAFLNGSVLASSPTSPPTASTGSSSITPLDPMALSNIALMASEVKKNNADAEAQEIENKRMRVEDVTHNTAYYDPDTDLEINDLPSWLREHPNRFPDTVIIAPHSEGATGRFNARKAQNEFRKEVSDTNASVVKNYLEEMVANEQIKDPMIILSLARMPQGTFDKLVQETKTLFSQSKYYDAASGKFDAEKALTDLETKLKNDMNIMPYIDKVFDGKFEARDLAKVIMLGVMSLFNK